MDLQYGEPFPDDYVPDFGDGPEVSPPAPAPSPLAANEGAQQPAVNFGEPFPDDYVPDFGDDGSTPVSPPVTPKAPAGSKPGYLSNLARGIGERGLQLVGGTAGIIGDVGEAGADWLNENVGAPVIENGGITYRTAKPGETEGRNSWITQKLEEVRKGLENPDLGYDARTTWEDVKNQPWKNVVPFAIEQGIVSAPDMYTAVTNVPAYIAEQTGEISRTRAQNEGRTEPTFGDIVKAAPAATVSAWMEKLGTSKTLGLGEVALTEVKQLPVELFKTLLTEGATEAMQQAAQIGGESAFTQKGIDWWKSAEEVAQAGVVGAIFGPAVRGPLAGLEIATASKENQHDAAKDQKPPGVADEPPAPDLSTPGGQSATSAPPPPNAKGLVDPGVSVVEDGAVPGDLAAAATGVTSPSQPRSATGLESPVAAPADVTTPEEGEEDYEWSEEVDNDYGKEEGPDVPDPAVSPVQPPIREPDVAQLRADQALSPNVVTPATDEAAALAAIPQQAAQQAPVIPAPAPVAPSPTPEVTPNEQAPAQAVPSAPVAEAPIVGQTDLGPPAATDVGRTDAGATLRSALAEEPDDLAAYAEGPPDLTIPEGPPDLTIPEAPAAARAKKTSKARAPKSNVAVTLDPYAGFEPAASEIVKPAEESAPRSNYFEEEGHSKEHAQVSHSLVDNARVALRHDMVSNHPRFEDALDEAVREVAPTIKEGSSPAQVVRLKHAAMLKAVRAKVKEFVAEDIKQERRTAAREEEKHKTAKVVHKQQMLEGTKQELPRTNKAGEKIAGAVAIEDDRSTESRLQKKAQRTEDEDTWLRLNQERKKMRGSNRRGHDTEMAKIRDRLVAEQQQRDAAKETEKEEKHKKAVEVAEKNKEAAELAETPDRDFDTEQDASDEEIAARRDKGKAAATSAPAAAAALDPNKYANKGMIKNYIDAVKKAMSAAGITLGETVDPVKYSPEENLAIFANRIVNSPSKEPGLSLNDVTVAQYLLGKGFTKDFYNLLNTNSHGSTKQITAADLAENAGFAKAKRAMTSEYMHPDEYTFEDDKGKHTVQPQQTMSAAKALAQAKRNHPTKGGLIGYFRRNHIEALTSMVGDVPVMWVSADQMPKSEKTGLPAFGIFMHPNVNGMQAGQKGVVMINADMFNSSSPERQAHVVEHELTHAATVYALDTDFRGTRAIVRKMMDAMRVQLVAAGVSPEERFFKNEKEFIAEAFTNERFQKMLSEHYMSEEMTNKLGIPSDRAPTWWAGVIAAVRHALGLKKGSRGERTYLDGVMRVHPDVMLSEAEQYQRADDDWLLGAHEGATPTSNEYGWSAEMMAAVDDVKDRVKASRFKKALGNLRGGGRLAAANLNTTEELVRRAESLLGSYRNPFQEEAHLSMMREARTDELRADGVNVAAHIHQFLGKNRKEAEKVSDVLFNSTLGNVDPSVPPDHVNNKLSKKGYQHRARRRVHKEQAAQYQALSPEGKQIFHEVVDFFRGQQNAKVNATVENIVDTALAKEHVKLPAGVTRQNVIDFVLNETIDKKPDDMTADEKELMKALGTTGESLAGMKELRKVKGVYVPLIRHGKKFFTARETIATPAGATRGEPTKDNQTFIFKDKKAAEKFMDETEHNVTQAFTRTTDPATGLTNDPTTGKKYTLGDSEDYEPYYHVRVMDKVMEMADNEAELETLREHYTKQGYTTSQVANTEQSLYGADNIRPPHVNRLIKNIEQSKQSDFIKTSAKAGIIDAYVRTMAGSRSQHRSLKRAGVKGFSQDLVQSMLTSNTAMAGHIANLELQPKIAAAEDATNKLLNEIQHGKQPRKGLAVGQLVTELRKRRTASYAYRETTTLGSIMNNAMNVSYLASLASPSFSIINSMQPLVTTLPVLAADHNAGAAMRALSRASYDVGMLRTLGTGLKETAAEVLDSVAKTPGLLAGKDLMTRGKAFDYHDRIVAVLKKAGKKIQHNDAKAMAVERMRQLGFGTGSGIDIADLSELHKTRFGKILNRQVRAASALPQAVESNNRYITAFAAVDIAKKKGMTDEQAADYAVSKVEQTQGGYANVNNPTLFSHPIGKIALQFKKFSLMFGQMFFGNALRAIDYSASGSKAERKLARRYVLNLSVMGALFAGAAGSPFAELARLGYTLVQMMTGDDDETWDEQEAKLETLLASVIGSNFAEYAIHGLTRAAGVDVSNRMGNDSTFLFGNPDSTAPKDMAMWLLPQFAGAPGGMVANAYKAMHDGDMSKFPLPKFMKDTLGAYGSATTPLKTKTGATTIRPATGFGGDTVKKVLGFKPASEAREWEAGGKGLKNKSEKHAKAERTTTMQEWLNAPASQRPKIFQQTIQEYNRGKSAKDRITMSDLLRNDKRRKTEQKKKDREGG